MIILIIFVVRTIKSELEEVNRHSSSINSIELNYDKLIRGSFYRLSEIPLFLYNNKMLSLSFQLKQIRRDH